MLDIIYPFIAALAKSGERVFYRYIMINEDGGTFTFVHYLLGSLFLLPFFLLGFQWPSENIAWLIALISGICWAMAAFFGFKSYSLLQLSYRAPISKSKVFFVLILSMIFLKEVLTFEKILGTILIFFGIIILSYKHHTTEHQVKRKGILFTIISVFLMAIALLIDKYNMQFFNTNTYAFLTFILPAAVLLPIALRNKSKITSILRNKIKPTIAAAGLCAFYYYLVLYSLKRFDASTIAPILELSTVMAVIWGILFLKERQNILKKLIATAIVFVGALIISGVLF
jgi:drug/metabolite transporter (DMT)-like permease